MVSVFEPWHLVRLIGGCLLSASAVGCVGGYWNAGAGLSVDEVGRVRVYGLTSAAVGLAQATAEDTPSNELAFVVPLELRLGAQLNPGGFYISPGLGAHLLILPDGDDGVGATIGFCPSVEFVFSGGGFGSELSLGGCLSVLPALRADHTRDESWFDFAQASLRLAFSQEQVASDSEPPIPSPWRWRFSAEGAYGGAGIGVFRGM